MYRKKVANSLEKILGDYRVDATVLFSGKNASILIKPYEKQRTKDILLSDRFPEILLQELKNQGVDVDIEQYDETGRICSGNLDIYAIVKNSQLVT